MSSATNSARPVCTVSSCRPVTLASTEACGSASAHHSAASVSRQLAPDLGDAALQLLRARARKQARRRACGTAGNIRARRFAGDLGALLGHQPEPLGLVHVELGLDRLRRPMRRDPVELILRALGVGAEVLIVGRSRSPLSA